MSGLSKKRALYGFSNTIVLIALVYSHFGCKNIKNEMQSMTDSTQNVSSAPGSFGYDLTFLEKQKPLIVLQAEDNPDAQIIVIGDYQGRVMTSTADGLNGNSYGWINYDLIESGKLKPHMNAFGGEERLWLSPEGGQFSIFFKKGAKFDFENWQTPSLIDTESYENVESNKSQATFKKRGTLENYSGTDFDIEITRKISVLSRKDIEKYLKVTPSLSLKYVGFESENIIKNIGKDWSKDKGTLGIWILGMYNPSEETTMIAPFTNTKKVLLTDDYFGKIPDNRLKIVDSVAYFKGDGKSRGKIGLAPPSAKPFAGAYDAERGILTIVQFDLDTEGDYLKSTWERHSEPYKGDAFNAYNDGKTPDGSQLGPFIELESNSSTKALKTSESITHHHRTFHFEGDKKALNDLSKVVLGVNLSEIEGTLK
ncbi:DUF6786 family protein [Emticicia sp. SJ17W-69]|uniref:DUF6786 family protein n=1 Tax=Emticicia sp. SJ17W-69 TaxID=3421657 RepID=UPI003EC06FD7